MTPLTYSWSPSWTCESVDGLLRISAGADMTFDLKGLNAELVERVLTWTQLPIAKPNDTGVDIFEQLVAVGALVPTFGNEPHVVSTQWFGTVNDETRRVIEERVGVGTHDAVDFKIMLRTNCSWSDLLDELPTASDTAYLFVDLAYHHTISLGPFVVPGDTACAGCLAGRVRERWGDTMPAPVPHVLENSALITELIALEVRNISTGNPSLLNATCSWDLSSGLSKREALYRVPKCPYCDSVPVSGIITLPWAL